ncbi:MAG: hypothetical protein ABIZ07_13700 [Dermatophilaceae bacterium]
MSRDRALLSPEVVHALILPTEPWLSCDDCFNLMDEFAEAMVTDTPAPRQVEMTVHVEACSACLEEVDSLVRLLAADAGTDPAPALARLRP